MLTQLEQVAAVTNEEVKQMMDNAWQNGDVRQLKYLRDQVYYTYKQTKKEAFLKVVAAIDMRIMSCNGGSPM